MHRAGALTQVDFVSDQYDGYRQDVDGILLLQLLVPILVYLSVWLLKM